MKTRVHEIALVEPLAENSAARSLVDMVLLLALRDKAKEIRFQPTDDECKLSYQIGDTLYDMVPAPAHVAKKIINVIKVMADLDFASRDRSKERWIHLKVGNHLETMQVFIQRGERYEEAVVRLLHPIQASEEANKLLRAFSKAVIEKAGAPQ